MAESIGPRSRVYRALYGSALAMTSIGVLAHEAVRNHSHAVFTGPDGRRLAVKTDGTVEAALWREAIRVWAEHHPQAGGTWAEAVEEGWPEYLVADKYHLFVHRKEDYNKTARTAVLDYQGPDTYMYFQPPITGIDRLMPRPPAPQKKRTTVRLVAFHDSTGRMTTASVFAPQGKESELFRFKVDPQAVMTQIGEWHMQDPHPWLDLIRDYGSMVLPHTRTPGLPLSVTTSTERPPQHETAASGQPSSAKATAAGGGDVGPRFTPTNRTQRPPAEPDPAEQTGTSDSAGPST